MRVLWSWLALAVTADRRECYMDDNVTPKRCSPPFHNIAYERPVLDSNTCGMNGPETYYRSGCKKKEKFQK